MTYERCLHCRRSLTDPVSRARGFGPDCVLELDQVTMDALLGQHAEIVKVKADRAAWIEAESVRLVQLRERRQQIETQRQARRVEIRRALAQAQPHR